MPPSNKTESDDFRKYLDERFNSLHFRFDILTKNQEDAELNVKELAHIVETIRQVEAYKCSECANTKDIRTVKKEIEDFKKEMSEVMFIKKYYKPFLLAAAVTIFGIIYTGAEGYSIIKKSMKLEAVKNETIKTEMNTKINTNTESINTTNTNVDANLEDQRKYNEDNN